MKKILLVSLFAVLGLMLVPHKTMNYTPSNTCPTGCAPQQVVTDLPHPVYNTVMPTSDSPPNVTPEPGSNTPPVAAPDTIPAPSDAPDKEFNPLTDTNPNAPMGEISKGVFASN